MTGYDKLKRITDEIPHLISSKVEYSDKDFKIWKSIAKKVLIQIFGEGSFEYTEFIKNFEDVPVSLNTPKEYFINECKKSLEITRAIFQTYLDDLSEEHPYSSQPSSNFSRVFIVHGHDGELRESVARLVEKQGIEAVILSEQVNQGKTIIEKFERYSDVAGAICLFTGDDIVKEDKNENGNSKRPRQNVVFETGFFIGKIGRGSVIIIANRDIEMPSDLSGVVYTDSNNWKYTLLKELKAIGYEVDANKLI